MQGYLAKVQNARAQFKGFILKQILRGQNSHADSLAMLATLLESSLPWVVIIEKMDSSSLTRAPLVGVQPPCGVELDRPYSKFFEAEIVA